LQGAYFLLQCSSPGLVSRQPFCLDLHTAVRSGPECARSRTGHVCSLAVSSLLLIFAKRHPRRRASARQNVFLVCYRAVLLFAAHRFANE
ncbi:MAG: hypothetical protein ACK55Z_17860, partial [bacterium]